MNRIGIIGTVSLATFIIGIASGMTIGGRRNSQSPSLENRHPHLKKGADLESSVPGAVVPDSREHSSHLDSRAVAGADPLKTAQALWDMAVPKETGRGMEPRTGPSLRNLKLRPEMAEFFIGKYRELDNSTSSDRQFAMEMAISCGGPRAVDFLRELAETPAEGFQEYLLRTVAADALSQGHLLGRPKQFPVDEALLQQTQVLMNSSRSSDRRLAVAILGFTDVRVSVPAITDRLRLDPDPLVREQAVRELGRIGDAASLDFLRSQGTLMANQVFANYVQPEPVPGGPPVRYTAKNIFLRVLKDTIEQLEERLQK